MIRNEPHTKVCSLICPFLFSPGNVLADSIDNSISGDSLASLIQMPGGCVEQNLASITLPLIATLYLDRSDNWISVGVQRKEEALRYIRRGYANRKNSVDWTLQEKHLRLNVKSTEEITFTGIYLCMNFIWMEGEKVWRMKH